MKDFCFQENLRQRNAAEKNGRKKNQNKESSEAPVSQQQCNISVDISFL
jgi:hypothetical protein